MNTPLFLHSRIQPRPDAFPGFPALRPVVKSWLAPRAQNGLKNIKNRTSLSTLADSRLKIWLGIVLAVALTESLTGCASYVGVDSGYDEPVYYDGWYPDADVDLFGGGYYDGGNVYGYSHRGHMSRGGGGWGHGGSGHLGGIGHGGGGGHGR